MLTNFVRKYLIPLAVFFLFYISIALAESNYKHDTTRINIPDLKEKGTYFISAKDQKRIRYQLINQLHSGKFYNSPVLDNELAQEFITRILKKLKPNNNYKNYILANHGFNASANLGNIIITNLGIWEHLDNVNSLAAVLAHEIIHLDNRHISRILAGISEKQWLSMLTKISGIALINKDPQVAQAIIISDHALQLRGLLSYTRQMEEEADRGSLSLLINGGFSVEGLTDLMMIMKGLESVRQEEQEFLRTHPLTSERIKKAQQLVNSIKNDLQQNPKNSEIDTFQREYDLIRYFIGTKNLKPKLIKKIVDQYQMITDFKKILTSQSQSKEYKNLINNLLANTNQLKKLTDLELAVFHQYLMKNQQKQNQLISKAREIYPSSILLAKLQINEWLKQNQGVVDQQLGQKIIKIISIFDLKEQTEFHKQLAIAYRSIKENSKLNLVYADLYLAKSQLDLGNISNCQLILASIEKKIKTKKINIPQTMRWELNRLKSEISQI